MTKMMMRSMLTMALVLIAVQTCEAKHSLVRAATLNDRPDTHARSRQLTIFGKNEYCAEIGENEYQTRRVISWLSWLYELINKDFVEGSCGAGTVCEDICNHVPCVPDFAVPDDELCNCFPDVTATSCGPNTACLSDTCTCNAGYEGTAVGAPGCTDIDECTTPVTCGPNGSCTNAPPGSFTCTCNAGYEISSDGSGACVDVNECTNGSNPCGPFSSCTNVEGSFTCLCEPGFAGNPPTTSCADINECTVNAAICGPGVCSNTVGAYTCACETGYTSTAPNGGCVDVNECEDPQACAGNEDCFNTVGSFTCSCKDGFTRNTDSGFCEDDNECLDTLAVCGPNADCTNTPGSFTCECQDFFDGGEPPNCRKLNEFEMCESVDSCADGLMCEFTSRSDQDSTICCSETGRCQTNDLCCNGAYTEGQLCPSGSDLDCRGDLTCESRPFRPDVCCDTFLGLCFEI